MPAITSIAENAISTEDIVTTTTDAALITAIAEAPISEIPDISYPNINPVIPNEASQGTNEVYINPYLNLITSEFQTTKFLQIVQLLTDALYSNTVLAQQIQVLYNIDSAIGQQLDYIGEWVGISRYISPAITDSFFEFDSATNGFDLGYWQDQYSTNGISILPDDIYRSILNAKIAANHWDGTIPNAISALQHALPNNGLFIQDNQDMTMILGVTGIVDSLSHALITRGYFDIRPAGVEISYQTASKFFGFDLENSLIGGFDEGYWGNTL